MILSDSPNTIAPMTAQWNAPQQQPAAANSPPRRALWVVLATAAIVTAAVGGGIVGSALTATRTEPTNPAPATMTTAAADAADTHAQDVALCTRYAIVNASLPKRASTGVELLSAAAVLENALAANPGASSEISSALTAVVADYYGSAADTGKVRTRGLAEPPGYDLDQARAVYAQAWAVCGLDK